MTLEELKKERDRFKKIIQIKRYDLSMCKKVLSFYIREVRKMDEKIKELECQKNI